MSFVMNAWYVVAWPREITAEKPLGRTVCNQSLVLWRGADGAVAALEDRCCHREMPLAKGNLEAGTLRCPYHGLRFGPDGLCVEIPGGERIPPDLRVRRYPIVERYGWVWVWPGDAQRADPALVPDIHARNDHPDWVSGGGTSDGHPDGTGGGVVTRAATAARTAGYRRGGSSPPRRGCRSAALP